MFGENTKNPKTPPTRLLLPRYSNGHPFTTFSLKPIGCCQHLIELTFGVLCSSQVESKTIWYTTFLTPFLVMIYFVLIFLGKTVQPSISHICIDGREFPPQCPRGGSIGEIASFLYVLHYFFSFHTGTPS